MPTDPDPGLLCVSTIRALCVDAIQKANSGHPGTPMGIAPVAYALWQRVPRFDPEEPIWPNRDRLVLSEGHASALMWSLPDLARVRVATSAGMAIAGQWLAARYNTDGFPLFDFHLAAGQIAARVISMPCWELPAGYRDQVLPRWVRARVAIEQAATLGWDRHVGDGTAIVGMRTFGAPAR